MKRYNIFNLVHKGLRASLYQTALQLQQTDFSVENETEEILEKIREIILLFEGHAYKEDHYILPAIASFEPSVVATFELQRQADDGLELQLVNSVDKVANAERISTKLLAGQELNAAFVSFTAFNLQHLAKTEDIINPILWRYYTDDELKYLSARITGSTEPWIQDFYAKWIIRGINNREAAGWIRAIEKRMPSIVFETILTKAKQELPRKRFQAITASLSQGMMVA